LSIGDFYLLALRYHKEISPQRVNQKNNLLNMMNAIIEPTRRVKCHSEAVKKGEDHGSFLYHTSKKKSVSDEKKRA
jgi:hypothetical protein